MTEYRVSKWYTDRADLLREWREQDGEGDDDGLSRKDYADELERTNELAEQSVEIDQAFRDLGRTLYREGTDRTADEDMARYDMDDIREMDDAELTDFADRAVAASTGGIDPDDAYAYHRLKQDYLVAWRDLMWHEVRHKQWAADQGEEFTTIHEYRLEIDDAYASAFDDSS